MTKESSKGRSIDPWKELDAKNLQGIWKTEIEIGIGIEIGMHSD